MTLEDIRAVLEEIRSLATHDPEAAHELEDKLYISVLEHIASVKRVILVEGELAAEALKARKIDFARWMA